MRDLVDGDTDSGFLTVHGNDRGAGESQQGVFHTSEGEGWGHDDDSVGIPSIGDSSVVLDRDQIGFEIRKLVGSVSHQFRLSYDVGPVSEFFLFNISSNYSEKIGRYRVPHFE